MFSKKNNGRGMSRVTIGILIFAVLLSTAQAAVPGDVVAWGYNLYGQLGDGTTTNRLFPVQVNGLTGVTDIAGGGFHTIALKSDGTIWAWGRNNYGQLGDGTTTNRLIPVQVKGLTGIIAISGGGYHTIALKSDGTVWTWGNNAAGQLGDETNIDRSTPVMVKGLTGVTSIAGGYWFSLALRSDGTVWAWGLNQFGMLGDGTNADSWTPVQVGDYYGWLTNVKYIAAGGGFGIAVKNDGTVWGWGRNAEGQLGDETNIDRSTPVQVIGLTGVTAIAGGWAHTIALKSDGTVWAWGNNVVGQLGNGNNANTSTPVQVSGLTGVTAIAGGGEHTIALKLDGTVWAWGNNVVGQLGDGTTTNRLIPVQVGELTGVTGIAGGGWFTNALTKSRLFTFQTTDNAMPITIDETQHNSPYTVSWIDGTTHSIGVPSSQMIVPGQSQYVFTSWSGMSTSTSPSISITASSSTEGTYSANYRTQYYLTVNTSPAGLALKSGEGWYDSGTTAISGTAPSISGQYTFSTWKIDGASIVGNPVPVFMITYHTATAIYQISVVTPAFYTPPNPVNIQNTKGNFWVNHTWESGLGNITDSYRVRVNGNWMNSTNPYNNITVPKHGWSNITVWAYNNSGNGTLSPSSISKETQVANNVPEQSPIGNKIVTEGDSLIFTITAIDADFDTITYRSNASKGTLNSSTGVYSWATNNSDVGNYTWHFNSSDSFGGVASETITVTVIPRDEPLLITIVSPANNSNNYDGNVNVTVTLNRAGKAATLNWDGSNEQMSGEGTNFYLNKTGLLSGDFLFSINASDASGISNISEVRTIKVNRTKNYNFEQYVNKSSFMVNRTLDNIEAPSKNVAVTIPMESNASIGNAALTWITLDSSAKIDPVYSNGLVNDKLAGENLILGPEGARFNPEIQIRFNYTHDQLTYAGISESKLAVKYFDRQTNSWGYLTFSQNKELDYIIANTNHFSFFTLVESPDMIVNITSPQNNSIIKIDYVNVTATLSRPGNATLNWDGVNDSMIGSGTSFYLNKSLRQSGEYSFKVYSKDGAGSSNVSETRIITVNLSISESLLRDPQTGNLSQDQTFLLPSKNASITIFNGTNATLDGQNFENITRDSVRFNSTFVNISKYTSLIGENASLGPDRARFVPDIQIRFNYTTAQLTNAGVSASDLKAKFYNSTTNSWEDLPSVLNESRQYITVNTSHFCYIVLWAWKQIAPERGGGSGGGGGGGGISGENFSNIIIKEKFDLNIYKDIVQSYIFTNKSNPILFVNITGNVNAGEITTAVEVLRNTSSLLKIPAPDIVNRNINIWVGTSGFAPKNIKEAVIVFRVENSWININNLNSHEIKMVRWDGNKWISLETQERTKDSNYTYFEVKTNSFTHFAIIGGLSQKGSGTWPGATISPTGTIQDSAVTVPIKEFDSVKAPVRWEMILGIFAIIAIIVPLYRKWKY